MQIFTPAEEEMCFGNTDTRPMSGDVMLVTDDGAECLTEFPRDL